MTSITNTNELANVLARWGMSPAELVRIHAAATLEQALAESSVDSLDWLACKVTHPAYAIHCASADQAVVDYRASVAAAYTISRASRDAAHAWRTSVDAAYAVLRASVDAAHAVYESALQATPLDEWLALIEILEVR